MAYCGPRGIPLSVFLGWEEDDQDAALAWQSYETRRCSTCGHHPEEGKRHLHIDVCPGCVELQRVQNSEDTHVRGAVLRASAGTPGECARCRADAGLT